METQQFLFLCVVTCLLSQCKAARILAFIPTPSISHQIVFRPYTQELARRGHEILVVTTDPAFPKGDTPKNLKEIDVHDLSYKIWREQFTTLIQGDKDNSLNQMKVAFYLLSLIFEKQMQQEEVRTIIEDENQKFDLIISEACARISLSLSYFYKAPVIQFSSLGSMTNSGDVMGYPSHPILYPGVFAQRLYNLSSWEKMYESYSQLAFNNAYKDAEVEENAAIKRIFGPNAPELSELYNNIDLLMINVHPIWDDNRPVPPGVIYVGGILQHPEKELPKDLKSYLDSSKHGVIYLSFGTNVDPSLLPPKKIQAFINIFSQLPYDVIWKWNKDELPGRSENIKISKWLPQSDLLRHPNVKLFITQGGLQSTDEAITGGVPMIGMPMLADQWFNVEKYVRHKLGLRLDIETMTEENLRDAINTIIHDDSYRKNVVRIRNLLQDTPLKPLDNAIWWTEYVLRHKGAKQLRSPSANITWAQYFELELVLSVLGVIVVVLVLAISLVLLVLKSVSGEKVKKL